MSDFPYAQSPDKLTSLLKTIPTIGKPDSFDTKRLQSLGYTSSHDAKLLNVLKYLGLIEDKKGGGPTEVWQELRTSFGKTLGRQIKDSYSDLFSIYPNAHQKDTESLRAFFTANTSVGADTVHKITATFQTLIALAEFDKSGKNTEPTTDNEVEVEPVKRKIIQESQSTHGTININIQLQLPSDPSGEVYDKLFKSLKEHIWSPSE